jgi:hypothetical protein
MLSSRIYLLRMALLVSTIIASPALGESPSYDSECALSASSEMTKPSEVATRALPRSPLQPIAGTFPPMRIAKPLSAAEQRALQPQDLFKECEVCPEMVVVPAGEFTMGGLRLRKAAMPMSGLGAEWRLQTGLPSVVLRSRSQNGMLASPKAVARGIAPQTAVGGAGISLSSIFGGRMPGPT